MFESGKSLRRSRLRPSSATTTSKGCDTSDRLGDDFLMEAVLYTGDKTLPFGAKLKAIPSSDLGIRSRLSRRRPAVARLVRGGFATTLRRFRR
nr:hypothetical protein [Glycomyces tenuis]